MSGEGANPESLADSRQQLNALTDQLTAQMMQTPRAAATEQATYQELQIESDANNSAVNSSAESASRNLAESAFRQARAWRQLQLLKDGKFTLLNDQPVIDSGSDHLNSWQTAEGLIQILLSSRHLSPFVLAIDAEWGMGKSTVLGQMYHKLEQSEHEDVKNAEGHHHSKCVKFNAWTAENSDALQGVIAAVLHSLDPRTLRRWTRKLAQNRGLVTFLYACVVILAGFFGFSGAVSNFLTSLSFRGRSPNEVRASINEILRDWRERNGDGCTLIVFIDDLDRCSDATAIQICEAIKLYLDVPGLIFVLGWNLSALGRSAASAASDSSVRVLRDLIKKIVQLTYRLPVPNRQQIDRLIDCYAETSGTTEFLDNAALHTLAERTQRNPRRIKQIINGFIVEQTLDFKWAENPDFLIKAELIYQLYPRFYQLLIGNNDSSNADDARNLISDVIDYVDLRDRAADGDSTWLQAAKNIFQAYHIKIPPTAEQDPMKAIDELRQKLPEPLPELASDDELIRLLKSVGDKTECEKFIAMLKHSPLAVGAAFEAVSAKRRMQEAFDQVLSG